MTAASPSRTAVVAPGGMYAPGPLAASAAVLRLVATAVERFLDEVVWPS